MAPVFFLLPSWVFCLPEQLFDDAGTGYMIGPVLSLAYFTWQLKTIRLDYLTEHATMREEVGIKQWQKLARHDTSRLVVDMLSHSLSIFLGYRSKLVWNNCNAG